MGMFFIDTDTGQVATHSALVERGIATAGDAPPRPWHQVRGTSDASTLWYAVMRKRTRGVFIGTLCIRHSDHHASLRASGWTEVPLAEIGDPAPGPFSAERPDSA